MMTSDLAVGVLDINKAYYPDLSLSFVLPIYSCLERLFFILFSAQQ